MYSLAQCRTLFFRRKWFQLRLLCIFVIICFAFFVLLIAIPYLSCLDWNFSVLVSIGCSGPFILQCLLGKAGLVSLFLPRPKSA